MEEHKFTLTRAGNNEEIEIKISKSTPTAAKIVWKDLTVSECFLVNQGFVTVVTSPKKLVLTGDSADQEIIVLEGAGFDNGSPTQGQAKWENADGCGGDWKWKKIS